jgi:hypothetical protein
MPLREQVFVADVEDCSILKDDRPIVNGRPIHRRDPGGDNERLWNVSCVTPHAGFHFEFCILHFSFFIVLIPAHLTTQKGSRAKDVVARATSP